MPVEPTTLHRRVLRGQPRGLPPSPKGPPDDPEASRYVRRVADLEDPEEVIQTILARARRAADYRGYWEDEWRQAIRAWFQIPTAEREDSWESDRYLPLILKHVETALPSLVAATLDGNKVWRVFGLTPSARNTSLALERLINWQAYTTARCEEAYEDLYWWACLIGTSYIDHYWDYRVERKFAPTVQSVQGRPTKQMVEQDVTTADHPRVVCLNPFDVFPDPDAEMGDDAEWFVERVRTTIGDLRDAAGKGHIDGEALEEWIAEERPQRQDSENADWFDALAGYTWDELLREMEYQGRDDTKYDTEDKATSDKTVTVLRYRSKAEIVTLGSPRRIIGYSLNPYFHGKTGIVIHHFLKVPGCPFGRGIGTILLGHQEIANENINRWMDTAAIEAMGPVVVDRSQVSILDDEFVLEPNKIIRARSTDAIKRLDVPAPTALAMQLDLHVARDADDVTGFSEQARGIAPPASQTATAFSGLQNNIRTRLVLHVRRSARTIRLSGQLLIALDQQFLTAQQVVGMTGEDALDYAVIQPHEIVGETVVRAVLNASRASPEMRQQRLVQLTQILVPLFQGGLHRDPIIGRWIRFLLDENEVENADLILPRDTGQARDPLLENEAMKRGVRVKPHPGEDFMGHVQAHGQLHEEAMAAGLVGVASILQEHIQATLALAATTAMQQMGAGQMGAGGAAGFQGGNTEGELSGGATEGALARNGVPGVAAPGPGAALGRPVG